MINKSDYYEDMQDETINFNGGPDQNRMFNEVHDSTEQNQDSAILNLFLTLTDFRIDGCNEGPDESPRLYQEATNINILPST